MTRIIQIFSIFLLLSTFTAQAQGFFIELNRSYSWQALTDPIELNETSDTLGGDRTIANIFANQGGGFGIGGAVGYMFNPHFGVEMGFQYFLSQPIRAKTQDLQPILLITADAYTQQGRLMPGIIMSTGGEKFSLYNRMGMLMPIFGATYLEIKIKSSFLGVDSESLTQNTGRFSAGFYGGFGGAFKVGKHIEFNLEFNAKYLRVKSLQQTILSQKDLTTGLSTMTNLNTFDIVTNYVDEIDSDSNNPVNGQTDPDLPAELLTETSNYSGAGIQVGIKFNFPRKKKQNAETEE